MREFVYSAATLAGFVGLACLYQNGQTVDRQVRDTSMDSMFNELNATGDMESNADYDFLQAMGWLDDASLVPEEFTEDVKFYQTPEDARAGNAGGRKTIQFIIKCMKSKSCTERAMGTVKNWGQSNRRYMEGNTGVLLKPIATKERIDSENGMNICTPADDVWACNDMCSEDLGLAEDSCGASSYTASVNSSPSTVISQHPITASDVDSAASSSSAMQFVKDNLDITDVNSNNNVFSSGAGGVKIILVIPNGIPVSMAYGGDYQDDFGNYWGWFKRFNEKYVGITSADNQNRQNFHFWFIRQDKVAKMVMKNAAKANKRFPWSRFDKLMAKAQATAIQPKIAGTLASIGKEVQNKGLHSDWNEGQDCVTIWFHHYLPQDVLDLADTTNQEDWIKPLDKACNMIHIWVGFGDPTFQTDSGAMKTVDMSDTRLVLKYLQGLLQPSQIENTVADSDLRSWYYVSDFAELGEGKAEGDRLSQAIYNNIALDRQRVKCLLQSDGRNIAAKIDEYVEQLGAKTDEFEFSYYETSEYPSFITEPWDTEAATSVPDWNEGISTDYIPAVESDTSDPDMLCCGIGFSGESYDSSTTLCCDDEEVWGGKAKKRNINDGCWD